MGSQVYLAGKELEHPHEVHEHVSPKSLYLKILLTLLFLTVLTVLVSEANLGAASLPVAMIVAVMKASLVIAFFMHLKYDHRYHLFVFMGTLIFVGIFFGFTLFDLSSRTALNDEQGTFARWKDEDAEGNHRRIGVEIADPNACDKIGHHGGGHGDGHGDAGHGDAKAGHEAGHGDAKAGGHGDAKAGGHEAGHVDAKAGGHDAKAGH